MVLQDEIENNFLNVELKPQFLDKIVEEQWQNLSTTTIYWRAKRLANKINVQSLGVYASYKLATMEGEITLLAAPT